MTFYEMGSDRLEDDMDVDYIVKNISTMKYLLNNTENKGVLA